MKKHFITATPPPSGEAGKGLLLLLLLLAASLWACHKEDPIKPAPPPDYTVLPAATQEGKNTFGCKVNGQVWVPRVPLLAVTYRDKEATVWEKNGSGAGSIICNLVDLDLQQDNWMQITFGPTYFKNGSYCQTPLEVFASATFRKASGIYYESDFRYTSNNCVEITKIDTVKGFVSGTFNFTLFRDSTNLSNKIVISEGRFDLPYYPQ